MVLEVLLPTSHRRGHIHLAHVACVIGRVCDLRHLVPWWWTRAGTHHLAVPMLVDVLDHAHLLPRLLLPDDLLLLSHDFILGLSLRCSHHFVLLPCTHLLRCLRMHVRHTLIKLRVLHVLVQLLMAKVLLRRKHQVLVRRLLRRHHGWRSLRVARRVVRLNHRSRLLLRLVRIQLLTRQLLALQLLLLLLLNLLYQLHLLLFSLMVLYKVSRRVLDHKILRLVLGPLRHVLLLLMLRRVVLVHWH